MGNNVILISPLCDPYAPPSPRSYALLTPVALLGALSIVLDRAYKREAEHWGVVRGYGV